MKTFLLSGCGNFLSYRVPGMPVAAVLLLGTALGQVVAAPIGHGGVRFDRIAFAPDGRTLAAAHDEAISLWNIRSGTVAQSLVAESAVRAVAFSPDGRLLAAGESEGITQLWKMTDGKWGFNKALPCRGELVDAIAFSPDSKKIACGTFGAGNVHLYDTASGKLKRNLWEASNGINSVAFSRDGQTLASGGANLKIWDVRVADSEEQLFGLSLSELNATQGKWLKKELGDYAATLAAFLPQSNLVVSADGPAGVTERRKKVFIWDVQAGRLEREIAATGPGMFTCLAVSRDGQSVATGLDSGKVWVWLTQTGEVYWTAQVSTAAVQSIAFSPNESLLAAADAKGTLKFLNGGTGGLVKSLNAEK